MTIQAQGGTDMSETHWTKGKWEVSDDRTETRVIVRAEGGGIYVICSGILSDDEARLISCAPELYEALVDVEDRPLDFDLKRVRALLAKARGETKDDGSS
mgnify:CR=1 FL=1